MTDFNDSLHHLKQKMESEIQLSQPYEAMMYCQSFLARKKRSLNDNEMTRCLVEGCQALLANNEHEYTGKLITWFVDSKMLVMERSQDILALLPLIPPDHAIKFLDNFYHPVAKFFEAHSSSGGLECMLMLNTYCVPHFEAAERYSQALRCFHALNDMIGMARVLDLMAKKGNVSEYPLFFTRAYLYLLSSGTKESGILSDAFFVEVDNDYMGPFQEINLHLCTCQCWKMCELIHDLHELGDNISKSTPARINKGAMFSLLVDHYSPLLRQQDSQLLELLQLVGLHVFNVQPQRLENNNPMHAMIRNMFSAS